MLKRTKDLVERGELKLERAHSKKLNFLLLILLCEHQLIPTTKPMDPMITVVSFDAVFKYVFGQKRRDLSEDILPLFHDQVDLTSSYESFSNRPRAKNAYKPYLSSISRT